MNPEKISTENKWLQFGGFSPLITIFKAFHPLNEEIEKIINDETFPVVFKKNKFISSPLHKNKYIFLILEGTVRGFMKHGNKEITTWISKENELVGTIRNLWEDEATEEYIQAIEPILAIAIPHTMSKELYEKFPIANYVGRKMTEMYYAQAFERGYLIRLQSAERRYKRFLKSYPALIDRVPLKFIASFLGMRLETLSRIRAKINA
ncbi:Crp/Fnr family transcriptional regulator [Pedobacter aquatilis]|uniref:Crp/Fnr family transcriptional regulator n=1 Tax=Pedobacter aquatilis TaxID=351343 RepID=UPI0025B30D09|nr:Crp/Fnr family transcriptional regulator [Pedobacter aquatilis]MDN3588385.1 Crp/Fnr family transcriptional regulator [Pedobacter aquatilis]